MMTAPRIDEWEPCGAQCRLKGEVVVSLLCTLQKGHLDRHYDSIFGMEWRDR